MKVPKSANRRWPTTSAKRSIARMSASSEPWRIVATQWALECEGNHFEPVIKITNFVEPDSVPLNRRTAAPAWAVAFPVGADVRGLSLLPLLAVGWRLVFPVRAYEGVLAAALATYHAARE